MENILNSFDCCAIILCNTKYVRNQTDIPRRTFPRQASEALATQTNVASASPGPFQSDGAGGGEIRAFDQPVLSQGPGSELRQTRADTDSRFDIGGWGDTAQLACRVLGREPLARAAALLAHADSSWDHCAFDLFQAGIRIGSVVSRARGKNHNGWITRSIL